MPDMTLYLPTDLINRYNEMCAHKIDYNAKGIIPDNTIFEVLFPFTGTPFNAMLCVMSQAIDFPLQTQMLLLDERSNVVAESDPSCVVNTDYELADDNGLVISVKGCSNRWEPAVMPNGGLLRYMMNFNDLPEKGPAAFWYPCGHENTMLILDPEKGSLTNGSPFTFQYIKKGRKIAGGKSAKLKEHIMCQVNNSILDLTMFGLPTQAVSNKKQ